ncbi:hypothetical protein [Mesorhizobium sp. M0643]|uniref:hypothetical protein n=1 Tax=unclassified Mesorhizobium TaxID=325217 RepID=UPI003338DC78
MPLTLPACAPLPADRLWRSPPQRHGHDHCQNETVDRSRPGTGIEIAGPELKHQQGTRDQRQFDNYGKRDNALAGMLCVAGPMTKLVHEFFAASLFRCAQMIIQLLDLAYHTGHSVWKSC